MGRAEAVRTTAAHREVRHGLVPYRCNLLNGSHIGRARLLPSRGGGYHADPGNADVSSAGGSRHAHSAKAKLLRRPHASPSEGGTSNGGTRSCKSPIIAGIITSPVFKAPRQGSRRPSDGPNCAHPGNAEVSSAGGPYHAHSAKAKLLRRPQDRSQMAVRRTAGPFPDCPFVISPLSSVCELPASDLDHGRGVAVGCLGAGFWRVRDGTAFPGDP